MRLRIIDLETSGLEATDHVVEIAAWDLLPDQGPVGILNVGSRCVKPPVPIPPLASAIHHITDDDVALAQSWAVTWPLFVDDGVDAYAAHNAKFDRTWFTDKIVNGKPFICSYRCALRIWPGLQSHSNQALRYLLKPEGLDRSIASAAHRASGDAYVTAFIVRECLKHAPIEKLIEWSNRPALLPRINFGKHKGKEWKEIPPDYINWMIRQPDMGEDIMFSARHFLGGVS